MRRTDSCKVSQVPPIAEANQYAQHKVHLDILEGLQVQKSFFDETQEKYPIEESWRGESHPAELQDLSERIAGYLPSCGTPEHLCC